ncbi:hypothetical protein HQN60_11270 [Deefgea piscis]|uniref:Uncharacterized protein n=1 Tax=Deefgea piscis TaxID=2739061 RepID=A0A6M8SSX1_9NEIS|nr:hypothetical protein [Deefgea piscis]QKJ67234.1 hypothetical protein HQN60_11270 [Deefgea piscis]
MQLIIYKALIAIRIELTDVKWTVAAARRHSTESRPPNMRGASGKTQSHLNQ